MGLWATHALTFQWASSPARSAGSTWWLMTCVAVSGRTPSRCSARSAAWRTAGGNDAKPTQQDTHTDTHTHTHRGRDGAASLQGGV